MGLFALIALAGFGLLRAVLDTQSGTESRLRRMSEIQRALFVVASDLDQISGPVEGDATTVTFQKVDAGGRPFIVRYGHQGDELTRTISGPLGESAQPLLKGVSTARWSYHLGGTGWVAVTPAPAPVPTLPMPETSLPSDLPPPARVGAVAIDLDLVGVDGRATTVRRVIPTPEMAP